MGTVDEEAKNQVNIISDEHTIRTLNRENQTLIKSGQNIGKFSNFHKRLRARGTLPNRNFELPSVRNIELKRKFQAISDKKHAMAG